MFAQGEQTPISLAGKRYPLHFDPLLLLLLLEQIEIQDSLLLLTVRKLFPANLFHHWLCIDAVQGTLEASCASLNLRTHGARHFLLGLLNIVSQLTISNLS